jgi:hypothetical protein
MTTEKQPINEPSVLDYLKSRLKFWARGEKVELPAQITLLEKSPFTPAEALEIEGEAAPEARPEGPEVKVNHWPWRGLSALGLALLAQLAWEPAPGRTAGLGLVLYALALAMAVWAYSKKEWNLTPQRKTGTTQDPLTVRILPLLAGTALAMAAFIFLGRNRLTPEGNLFTPLNVTLWVGAILCFVWALWVRRPATRTDLAGAVENGPMIRGNVLANDQIDGIPVRIIAAHQDDQAIPLGVSFATRCGGSLVLNEDGSYSYSSPAWDRVPPGGVREEIHYTLTDAQKNVSVSPLIIHVKDSDRPLKPKPFWTRLGDKLRQDSWKLTATRWTLLALAVVGIVVFVRLYNLNTVPSEPFSDHAEKILDVFDVSQGQTHIFFPRNTGREAIQMYLTLVVAWIFKTGLSFLSLKIGTVICGLVTLPYMYLLGKELGGKRLGLLAVFFTGIGYWPNVISRVGLRFPLYPLFVAPTLYYLIRGLRTRNRNDFILSGLFLGFGLHGYSPFRIVPLVIVVAVGLYLLHAQSRGSRRPALAWLGIVAVVSFIVFLPLARYWLDYPAIYGERAFSRMGTTEAPLPGPAGSILLSNTWNAVRMFNWDDGEIWVHSVTHRPALDVVSGALFLLGIALLLLRYIRERHWLDLFLILAVPLLELPSILSLAFPTENPALNRAGGALVPAFLIVAVALDGLLGAIAARLTRRTGIVVSLVLMGILGIASFRQNNDLVFRQYAGQFDSGAWNTSEMGAVIKQFGQTYGETDTVWIVPYPYWVDTRLPGVWAGIPNRDFVLWPQDIASTETVAGPKLIMLNTADEADVATLRQLYPQGVLSTFHSATKLAGKDFFLFFIPPEK